MKKQGAGKSEAAREERLGVGGFSFVEVLLALTLAFLLVSGAGSLVLVHSRASARAASLADRMDAARVVRGVLGAEILGGMEGRDWAVFPSDSLVLRAYRGVALPCGPATDGTASVAVRGDRRPEPVKDSVLVLFPDGRWGAFDLHAAVSTGPIPGSGGGTAATPVAACGYGAWGPSGSPSSTAASSPPGSPASREAWTVPGLDGEFLLARLFERGSYHLADEAFRYRIGAGGRQPLTQALFDPVDSGLETPRPHSGVVRLRLAFPDPEGGAGRRRLQTTVWSHRP